MPILYEYGLVVAVISKTDEEDAAAEYGDLESLDIDVNPVLMPCPCAYSPRDGRCYHSVKVEQKEDGPTMALAGATTTGWSRT